MPVLNVNDASFKEELSSNNKVVVKYYADWCGSCKLIAPKFRRFSDDERFTGIKFLEVNAEEQEQARKVAGVDNLPFFAVFANGELVKGTATSKEEKIIELISLLK
jgi:thiol-disulfide isomerase/thioredoxin